MSVQLNHTIIAAKDKWASAKFLADILNLEAGPADQRLDEARGIAHPPPEPRS